MSGSADERVSLVMLAHNQAAVTRRTLEALLQSTYADVEAVLVDNGSTDGTPEVLSAFERDAASRGWHVRRIGFPENVGAVAGRNAALEVLSGGQVVFLDNDVVIGRRSWLEILREELARDGVGIVGPQIRFAQWPDRLQCAGCEVTENGFVVFRGRGETASDPAWNEERFVPALISACWMMRREVVRALGPLDMRFHPVQYEDIDYCYRARAAGWRVLYSPRCHVYHLENVTTDGAPEMRYRYRTLKNGRAFREKWAETIAAGEGPPDAAAEWTPLPKPPPGEVGPLAITD